MLLSLYMDIATTWLHFYLQIISTKIKLLRSIPVSNEVATSKSVSILTDNIDFQSIMKTDLI